MTYLYSLCLKLVLTLYILVIVDSAGSPNPSVVIKSRTSPPFYIYTYPPEADLVSKDITLSGFWSKSMSMLLTAVISQFTADSSCNVIDIGSNIGNTL